MADDRPVGPDELSAFLSEQVREIVRRKLPDVELSGDEALFETGLLDSIDFLMLVTSMEERFGVVLDLSERDPAEFQTIAGLTRCAVEDSRTP